MDGRKYTPYERARLAGRKAQKTAGWSLRPSEKAILEKRFGNVTHCPSCGGKLIGAGLGSRADPSLVCSKCSRVFSSKRDLKTNR
jgi:transposase-like protein